jgi:DNA-binding transcriptional MerR regulator
MATTPVYTIGDLARHFGCKHWQVRRVFERGLLPPARRVGAYRVVFATDLPQVEAALSKCSYLPKGVAHVD